MNKEQKQAAVKGIGEELEASNAIFAVDYRGISVPQAAELRGKLREADASFNVVKNRLAKRITSETGTESLDEHLVGPTALTYIRGDAVVAAKAITDFIKEHEILVYKGGIMDGAPLDPEQFRSISRLPGLDVLHGQLVGMTAAPLTGVVRGLNGLISGLASQLGQIAEQSLVAEGAPAESAGDNGDDKPEAPAADEPAGDDEPAVDAEPQTEEEKPEEPKSDASEDGEDPSGDPAPQVAGEPEIDAPAEDAGESDNPGGDAEVVPDGDDNDESEDETDTDTKED